MPLFVLYLLQEKKVGSVVLIIEVMLRMRLQVCGSIIIMRKYVAAMTDVSYCSTIESGYVELCGMAVSETEMLYQVTTDPQ